MAEQYLKCPNCGANATNHQNCEYCGSLLVRFVEKGIDLSKTTYMTNEGVFPGLAEELRRNLRLQKENQDEPVVTDIDREFGKVENPEDSYLSCVLRTGYAAWQDDSLIDSYGKTEGLIIVFSFPYHLNNKDEDDYVEQTRHLRFKELDSFQLFTERILNYNLDEDYTLHQYALDFGSDADGAARLISEIIQKVYLVPLSERITVQTGVGDDIDNIRKQEEMRKGINSTDGEWPWWYYVVGGLILLAISKLFF